MTLIHAPKVTKIICNLYRLLPAILSVPLSTTAANSAIRCRCGSSLSRVPSPQALYGIFPPFPLSTTAAKPAIRCRCGSISRVPFPQALYGIFPPFPLFTTAAKPAIRCRCGNSLSHVSSLQAPVRHLPSVTPFHNGSKSHDSVPLWKLSSVCYGSYFAKRHKLRALCRSLELQIQRDTS